MKYTPNLGLRKPEQTDQYDIDDHNFNTDLLDEHISDIKEDYLLRSGGIMTGNVRFSQESAELNKSTSTGTFKLSGGAIGASVTLSGKDNADLGSFNLSANDGTNTKSLIGAASGKLTWDGFDIITSNGGTVNRALVFRGENDYPLRIDCWNQNGAFIELFDSTNTATTRSRIVLRSPSHDSRAGWVEVDAKNATNTVQLLLKPNGEALWNNRHLVRSINGVFANTSGNVTIGVATAETAGIISVASEEDELTCTCDDAAITPKNLYKLSNYRTVNTAYAVGDTVGVPYHANLFLECTTAGTTSGNALVTKNVTAGSTITDGTVVWEVKSVADMNAVDAAITKLVRW